MDILPIVFAVVMIILTVVLSVVGVQVIMVLNEVRRTLRKINTTLDTAEKRITAITQPLQNLGGVANGLNTGFKVFEGFVKWLNRDKDTK
jgi:uncharacterized protein YoxC